MLRSSEKEAFSRVSYLVGGADIVERMAEIQAMAPFTDAVLDYLDDVSRRLLTDREVRAYSDVVTFAFWIRRASMKRLSERFVRNDGSVRLGRGVVFHIAPSNVPVNFAYSLVASLVCGNANVVRVSSKDFEQVVLIARALDGALDDHEDMRPYVALVRYGHDREVNDALSAMADVRVVWGGDATIAELRKSPLLPRSTEVAFADRWSLVIIDSDVYLATEDKDAVAQGFYNDTYLSDQNACSSPRLVVWTGGRRDEAKREFWGRERSFLEGRYELQPVLAVNKLTTSCLAAVAFPGCRVEAGQDNMIVRVHVDELPPDLMELCDNSGYFYEYDCENVMELRGLCDDRRCQTLSYLGDGQTLMPLVESGIRGIDRIVPIGKTMDFDLLWDGYDLIAALSRSIVFGR